MQIVQNRFPDRFLTIPNSEYFFAPPAADANPLQILETFTVGETAEIYLTALGAIGFHFLEHGPLASIDQLQFSGSGLIPETVTANHDKLVELQTHRLAFANFIAAGLFGRVMAIRHTSLTGAAYSGLDQILTFALEESSLRPEHSRYTEPVLRRKIELGRQQANRVRVLTREELRQSVAFLGHLAERERAFQYANLQACMVMNYQGAILHNEQHAAASLGLNFAVAEALMKEVLHAYGVVAGSTREAFATKAHTLQPMSGNNFRRRRVANILQDLVEGGLIDHYLHQRLDEARDLRNNLMHGTVPVTLRQSGSAQTAVRDLWTLLIEGPFELNAGFTMRL